MCLVCAVLVGYYSASVAAFISTVRNSLKQTKLKIKCLRCSARHRSFMVIVRRRYVDIRDSCIHHPTDCRCCRNCHSPVSSSSTTKNYLRLLPLCDRYMQNDDTRRTDVVYVIRRCVCVVVVAVAVVVVDDDDDNDDDDDDDDDDFDKDDEKKEFTTVKEVNPKLATYQRTFCSDNVCILMCSLLACQN